MSLAAVYGEYAGIQIGADDDAIDRAISEFARVRGVSKSRLTGHMVCRQLTALRFECYALLRSKGLSYPRIGYFMRRDHSTVIHGVREYHRRVKLQKAQHVTALGAGL